MLIDISNITLENLEDYQKEKKLRKRLKKYLTDEKYEETKVKHIKEYQHNYWINVRKPKKRKE